MLITITNIVLILFSEDKQLLTQPQFYPPIRYLLFICQRAHFLSSETYTSAIMVKTLKKHNDNDRDAVQDQYLQHANQLLRYSFEKGYAIDNLFDEYAKICPY